MKTEKIFKREDGSQVQVTVDCFISEYSNNYGMNYRTTVYTRAKGKKKWISVYNPDDYRWRALSMEDRALHNRKVELEYVTIAELQTVALELWEQMKPKFTAS